MLIVNLILFLVILFSCSCFLFSSTQIHFTVAIDFTASNGENFIIILKFIFLLQYFFTCYYIYLPDFLQANVVYMTKPLGNCRLNTVNDVKSGMQHKNRKEKKNTIIYILNVTCERI